MDEEDQSQDTLQTLRFRELYDDGRVVTVITTEKGGWKVEVFASIEHAQQFAQEHGLQVM